MDPRLPKWLKDDHKLWIRGTPGEDALNLDALECISNVLEDLGWPYLINPPTTVRQGGYYGNSWTWVWGLGTDDPDPSTSIFIQVVMDSAGRTEIWVKIGQLSVIGCRWGSGHTFKYGYLTFTQIKQIWEALSGNDQRRAERLAVGIRSKYYTKVEHLAKL